MIEDDYFIITLYGHFVILFLKSIQKCKYCIIASAGTNCPKANRVSKRGKMNLTAAVQKESHTCIALQGNEV